MNTCTQLRPRLSDYLDRHLDEAGTREMRAHLASCADCRHLADDLVRVRGAAQSLGPITPPAHLWLEIAGRVRQDGGTPIATAVTPAPPVVARRADTWQWLGLAAALLLTTLAVYSLATPESSPAVVADAAGNATEVPTVETVEETMRRAEAEYEKAIAQLEQVVKSGDATVSAASVSTLQRSLSTIDSAIAESRAALTSSPDSQPARTSLFEALRNKVTLLQHTVVLMNEMRKGDATGAAQAAAGFGGKPS
ncbi:MAG TPA: zf-HC2 domain-containing protein [Vicinamibacterales bacterium]|nr:zf-HC2 domain-containing protein [Vicinamibacterales bacterium]